MSSCADLQKTVEESGKRINERIGVVRRTFRSLRETWIAKHDIPEGAVWFADPVQQDHQSKMFVDALRHAGGDGIYDVALGLQVQTIHDDEF